METAIKQLRIKANLSQSQLARRAGVNLRSLQDYEQGRKNVGNMRASVLQSISRELGCSVEEVLLAQQHLASDPRRDEVMVRGERYQNSVNPRERMGCVDVRLDAIPVQQNNTTAYPNQATAHPNQAAARPNQAAAHPNQAAALLNQAAARPNQATAHPNHAPALSDTSAGIFSGKSTGKRKDPFCLINRVTGDVEPTALYRLESRSLLPRFTPAKGWGIHWEAIPDTVEVYILCLARNLQPQAIIGLSEDADEDALYLFYAAPAPHNNPAYGAPRYLGVGELVFRIAAQLSRQRGYHGRIYGYAANQKYETLYVNRLGARTPGRKHVHHFEMEA